MNLLKVFLTLSLVSFLGLLGLYIFQTGQLSGLSYKIKQIENEISQGQEQNLALKTANAQELSIKTIDQKIASLDFVPVKEIKYLKVPDNLLVVKLND